MNTMPTVSAAGSVGMRRIKLAQPLKTNFFCSFIQNKRPDFPGTCLNWFAEEEGLPKVIPSGGEKNQIKVASLFLFGSRLSLKLRFAQSLTKQKSRLRGTLLWFAEEEGFEPPSPVKGCRFSRPVQSTALPLLCVQRGFEFRLQM